MEGSRSERDRVVVLEWGFKNQWRSDMIVYGVVRMSGFCFRLFIFILFCFPQIAVCADVKEVLLSDGNEKAIQSILAVRTNAGVSVPHRGIWNETRGSEAHLHRRSAEWKTLTSI